MMSTIDKTGRLIRIAEDGLAKIDGIPMFRKVDRDGVIYLQFCDHDRMRSRCRGTKFVEVPLSVVVEMFDPEILVKDNDNAK